MASVRSNAVPGKPAVTVYVYLVVLTGAALLVLVPYSRDIVLDFYGIAFFALITWLAEIMPITLPRQPITMSVGLATLLPLLILFGPAPAIWVAALATIRLRELRGRVSLDKILFNRAQLAISVAAAAAAFTAAGGQVGSIDLIRQALPTTAAGLAFVLTNMTMTRAVVALVSRNSFLTTWTANIGFILSQSLALTCLGILFAMVYVHGGFIGAILFTLPLALARYSFQLYVDLRDVFLATINALVSAIEAKDPYTHGHSTQTMEYALAIARQLGWKEDLIERLQYACVLHDIGKIGIPDSILKKEDTLTAEEYEVQKRHPVVGSDIVKAVKFLSRDVAWIRHHHERFDGRGYPDGLSGEDIPMGARIIAVADAFDAMTSARPYRPALSVEVAMGELQTHAGAQFDPQIVQAFLEVAPALDIPVKGNRERW